MINIDDNKNKKKVPWYFSMPFIIIVGFVLGGILYCIPGIILLILRCVFYPKKWMGALLGMGIYVFSIVFLFGSIYYISTYDYRKIDNAINKGNFTEAYNLLEANKDEKYGYYYDLWLKYYEEQGLYDEKADMMLEYLSDKELLRISQKTIDELKRLSGLVSESEKEEVELFICDIEKAIAEEAERLASEEAERLASEEAERLASEEAERLASEEADQQLTGQESISEGNDEALLNNIDMIHFEDKVYDNKVSGYTGVFQERNNYQYYYPDTFPYVYERSNKLAKLYTEAYLNSNKMLYLEGDKYEDDEIISYVQTLYESDYLYYGNVVNGRPEGEGVLFVDKEICYIGEFENGYFQGHGIHYNKSYNDKTFCVKYEGQFEKGKYEGNGVSYFSLMDNNMLGDNYPEYSINDYLSIQYCSESRIYDYPVATTGIYYNGEYKDGIQEGHGTLYWNGDVRGRIRYEGEFENGWENGEGTRYFYDTQNVQYEGEFENGLYDGSGTLYNEDGSIIYSGKFEDGDIK